MGADREQMREWIHSLIGSDKSHDIESAPTSAPYPLLNLIG